MPNLKIYLAYMVIMTLLTFILMGVDKSRAINHKWRIPEVVLLGMSLLGGCVGGFFAMHIFHHKTRYARFAMGIPVMIVIHCCIAVYMLDRFVF